MLMCFFLCQISTTKRQCVTYVTPFHITVSNSQIKTPTNSTYEPIKLCGDGDSEFLFAFFLLCFFLAIVGFGFVGFFFFWFMGLLVGFCHHRATAIELKQISHDCRQPRMNKMERFCGWRNKEVWVSAGLFGIGFWFLVAALCLWVFSKFVCGFWSLGVPT